mmetsp:Transcript_7676/g.16556  ORF Transcript_7676/g.16556 Transcript_7676/m.16556 type:complete len:202 (+) Transcript_7676:169-774(+)
MRLLQKAPNNIVTTLLTNKLVFFVKVLLPSTISGFHSNFLVILLKSSQILTSLTKLSFFHTLSNVPMHESTLRVHQIELVVNAAESFSNGGGVGHHAHSTLDTSKISSGNDGRRLVVDTTLESSGAPVHKLNGPLRLDGGHGGVHVFGNDVSAVHETASHVLSMTGITLGHHARRLEHRVGNLSNRELLMISLLCRDHGSI